MFSLVVQMLKVTELEENGPPTHTQKGKPGEMLDELSPWVSGLTEKHLSSMFRGRVQATACLGMCVQLEERNDPLGFQGGCWIP